MLWNVLPVRKDKRLTLAGLGVKPKPEVGLTANADATHVVMVSGTGILSDVIPSGLYRIKT
jgi:hypothetical protein